jgi:ribosome biogenesis SPOUT family RNA methylase Rps3
MQLVIENCEEQLSEWLWLEYRHCAEIWESITFTNVRGGMKEKLATIGKVAEKSFEKLFEAEKLIILDPLAEEELKTPDFADSKAVVIGGILGCEIPKGRTSELITAKAKGAKIRNLGEKQLTIDTAALVAKLIYLGAKLEDIEIAQRLEVVHNENERTVLPYGYVVIEDKVIITPGLIDYLKLP